jgi:cysteine-rich repeat protein
MLFAIALLTALLGTAPSAALAQPCGPGVIAPQCDGQCPAGQMCADSGGSCQCVPAGAPCSDPANPNGPPVCWGGCALASAVCATFAGGCMCLPGPTPTPIPTPTPTVTPNLCGNGNADPGELCDDNNTTSGDGCDANCTPTGCGNGIATSGEQCDGTDAAVCPGNCRANCTCAVCGDGAKEGAEECDGGDDTACPGECQASCTCGHPTSIAGGKLLVRDPGIPEKRKILWLSKGAGIDVALGGGFDPSANGATLLVENAGGGLDVDAFPLPAAGWIAKGLPPKVLFLYKGGVGLGACKVVVKNLKLLKVSCIGKLGPIDYTLDEPSQGSIGVRLASGSASFCTVFGGVLKDLPGLFSAKNAVAPAVCP